MAKKKLQAQYEVIENKRCVHDFEIGDKVTFIYDDGTSAPRFRRDSDGHTQYVHMSEVKRINKKKKGEAGDKFIVTNNIHQPRHYFDIGTEVTMVARYNDSKAEFKRASGMQQTINMKDVKRVKETKTEKTEEAEVKFELGDVVEILSTEGGTCNSAGDIGVITEMGGSDCRVQVPGKKSLGNWSPLSKLKHIGLTSSLEGGK